jgi:hypothetical protein
MKRLWIRNVKVLGLPRADDLHCETLPKYLATVLLMRRQRESK